MRRSHLPWRDRSTRVLLDRGLQEIALPRPLGPTSQLACITQEDASETVVDQEHLGQTPSRRVLNRWLTTPRGQGPPPPPPMLLAEPGS